MKNKLTDKQNEILNRDPVTHEQLGDKVKVVTVWGSHQHRSIKSLEDRGLVVTATIAPHESMFVFATREGQRFGIGRNLSLGARERTETKVTLNDSERFHLRKALEQYKPSFITADERMQLVKLADRLSTRGEALHPPTN